MSVLPPFDPRQVPVWQIDHDLPAVASSRLSPHALKARFLNPPEWQPEVVKESFSSGRPPTQAAVLVPIVMRGPEACSPTVLLTRRAAHMKTHSGQIAFPGGKVDPEDASTHATALREAQEEVGLDARHVQVIGELPTYVTGTSFWVTPVIALVSPDCELEPNRDEVDDIFEVPLSFLMNPANHQRHAMEWQGQKRHWFSMPYLENRPHANGGVESIERFIWGATAGMLRNFYRFLAANPTTREKT
ncbi:MAG: CoA pyrophosphatase [Limnohabitans sp.]|uniref:CoA pyrophosphatase n=1 Tax=Limnohabitans sp. TaxID=1907725 RepID=UPI00391DD338